MESHQYKVFSEREKQKKIRSGEKHSVSKIGL